jgi:hypothetical protein
MSWRQQLSVKHMKIWRTLIQLMLVAKLAACNLAYPVRCQSRSRVSPVAAVEFFIRGG